MGLGEVVWEEINGRATTCPSNNQKTGDPRIDAKSVVCMTDYNWAKTQPPPSVHRDV